MKRSGNNRGSRVERCIIVNVHIYMLIAKSSVGRNLIVMDRMRFFCSEVFCIGKRRRDLVIRIKMVFNKKIYGTQFVRSTFEFLPISIFVV